MFTQQDVHRHEAVSRKDKTSVNVPPTKDISGSSQKAVSCVWVVAGLEECRSEWGVDEGSLGWQDEGVYASSATQGPSCETLPHHALIRSAGLISSG